MPDQWIEAAIALLTLTTLEIVLGIDNIIFIAIIVAKLPQSQRQRATRLGLGLAMLTRIGLLLALSWVMRLTDPIIELFHHGFSGRDLILLGGGIFLLAKSTHEIHEKLEGPPEEHLTAGKAARSFGLILVQIMALDIVFSFDSVITAIGMAKHVEIMITAIIIAVIVMMLYANAVSQFVEKHPTMKMLALSFLILIGVMLVVEGFGQHVSKGYIYFAMGFAVAVEMLNMRLRKVSARPVRLHGASPFAPDNEPELID
ncbi:TerC family protein [bacterium]|nr:TerC family protein [bacterium]